MNLTSRQLLSPKKIRFAKKNKCKYIYIADREPELAPYSYVYDKSII